jgi:hypothetical protein
VNPNGNEMNLGEDAVNFVDILTKQISRHPLMQIQDLYKLIHQGALGSEHAVDNKEGARKWLDRELQELQRGPPEPIIEIISPSGDIVRVNLRPYLHRGGNPDSLLDAFIQTANKYRGSKELLRKCWVHARRMASEGRLPFKIQDMDEFMAEMEKQSLPAVHHSSQYEEAYQPSYRVVAAIYIPEILAK